MNQMKLALWLVVISIGLGQFLPAQTATPTVTVDDKCIGDEKNSRKMECTYKIEFRNLPADTEELRFEMQMLDISSWEFEPKPTPDANTATTNVEGRLVKWVFTNLKFDETPAKDDQQQSEDKATGTTGGQEGKNGEQKKASERTWTTLLTVSASPTQAKIGKRSWKADIRGKLYPEKVDALVFRYDPSLIRPVLAAGLNYLDDDHVDFQIQDDASNDKVKYLNTENDSHFRANATLGALIKIKSFKNSRIKSLDFLAALDFTDDTQNVLDGFVFGLGLNVNKYLEFVGGFSLRKGKELSRAFRLEAARLVRDREDLPMAIRDTGLGAADFERFTLNADGTDLADLELYDGFPLPQVGGSPFFENPLRDSFNKSWILGIAIPIDLGDMFTRRNTEE